MLHPETDVSADGRKSATNTLALRAVTAKVELCENWSREVRTPWSRQWRAAAKRSAGTGESSSQPKAKYSVRSRRKDDARSPPREAVSTFLRISSSFPSERPEKGFFAEEEPPSVTNLSFAESGMTGAVKN